MDASFTFQGRALKVQEFSIFDDGHDEPPIQLLIDSLFMYYIGCEQKEQKQYGLILGSCA